MDDETTLSALLCSRLCHDLISPVGAFSNGLEILAEEDEPEMRKQVMTLLGQSVYQTGARLMFFRIAFGSGGGFGETIPADSVRKSVEDYFRGGKIATDWRVQLTELTKDAAKVILNLALLASEALPRGGGITLEIGRPNGSLDIIARAHGDRILNKPEIIETLEGKRGVDQLDAKTAPAYLVRKTAVLYGGEVSATSDGKRMVQYRARLKKLTHKPYRGQFQGRS